MSARRLLAVVASIGAASGLAGCGFGAHPAAPAAPATSVPGTSTTGTSTTGTSAAGPAAKLAQAQRTHEYPTPAPGQTVVGAWRNPVQAVQVFATTYINWTNRTVSARLQALAEVSIGQARSAMSLAASQSAHDYELQRGGIANSGVVEAIAPVLDHRYQYAVVTREQTTATATNAYQGLAPAWHLTLATVTRLKGGLWVLSAWQPEN
jgi:hypothetical protein